jgi:hypothetical protein
MTKQTIAAVILCAGAAIGLATPAHAGDIVLTLSVPPEGYYDSPNGYDYTSQDLPPTTSTTIGTFSFSIPAGNYITGITLTGTFGNGDSPTTVLSDYYLGYSGNESTETAVEVASCDDISDNCYSGQNGPYTWTYTATPSDLTALASAINGGSLDFTYTWDNNSELTADAVPGNDQYIYAGEPTIDISYAPEPATFLFCFSGIAGIFALRRFRKA